MSGEFLMKFTKLFDCCAVSIGFTFFISKTTTTSFASMGESVMFALKQGETGVFCLEINEGGQIAQTLRIVGQFDC